MITSPFEKIEAWLAKKKGNLLLRSQFSKTITGYLHCSVSVGLYSNLNAQIFSVYKEVLASVLNGTLNLDSQG